MRTTYFVAGWLLAVVGCKSNPVEVGPPVSGGHLEAMVAFVKHESCEPTSCADFACDTVSDGQTKGLPSHLVRCRWTDSRTSDTKRCAFVHYSVDSASNGFGNLFLSSPVRGDSCKPDKAFSDLIKGTQGYTGRVP